ncbi:unnamed protein product [Owenia fusiformis]|uniref:Uncharacterized protein n=1 Tax=Owenia fusiformis TaxID=6347 RepID=A0A8J1T617_OWEFU|nr:unnamed protein product [Owenia fusiformis]
MDNQSNSEDTETQETEYFINAIGKRIFFNSWKPEKEPRALVQIVHGAAEHCLQYNDLANLLVAKDILVFGHDHVGHGQSDGDRVHVDTFHTYIDDVIKLASDLKMKYPNIPLILIGHSMGGLVGTMTILERPDLYQGTVLIAAALQSNPETATPMRIWAAKILAYFFPQMGIATIDPNCISRDPDVVKKYTEDPLNYHGPLKARWAVGMIKAIADVEQKMADIEMPLLILHGTEDKLCNISGSKRLHEVAKSTDKTLKIYEGFYHQIHKEVGEGGPMVRQEIVDWVLAHI